MGSRWAQGGLRVGSRWAQGGLKMGGGAQGGLRVGGGGLRVVDKHSRCGRCGVMWG